MTIRTDHVRVLALTGALAFGLTACGGEDEPAATTPASGETSEDAGAETEGSESTEGTEETEEDTEQAAPADGVPALADIWPGVIDNAESAESMTANIVGNDGQMDIDATLTGQLDDSNFQVDATVDEGKVSIIGDDGTYYIKGDEGFWTLSGAPDPATVADQWIEAPEDMGVDDTFALSSLWEEFFAEVPTDASDLQTSSAELGEVDGVEAYHYTIEGQDAEIWVSADGEDNLLKVLIGEGMTEPMEMTITDWNAAEPVEPPADAVPIEELMNG